MKIVSSILSFFSFCGILLFSTFSVNAQVAIETLANTNCTGVAKTCEYNGPSILINEICISPSEHDGSLITGSNFSSNLYGEGEWIELYNPDECDSVDISGYMLGSYDVGENEFSPTQGMGYILPSGTVVPPNGFVVVRGRRAPTPPAGTIDIIVIENDNNVCIGGGSESRFWFRNTGSWFAFYDRNGVPQDVIKWGDVSQSNRNGSPCIPANNFFNGTVASVPGYNASGIGKHLGEYSEGKTFVRIPDGGNWSTTMADEFSSMGSCNVAGSCENGVGSSTCNGSATVNPSFGVGPYTFLWNDPLEQKSATATQLCAGDYEVQIKDANQQTKVVRVHIDDNFFSIDSLQVNQPNCQVPFGSAFVYASAEVDDNRTFQYQWSPNVSSMNRASGLSAGIYTVTVNDGFCARDTQFTILDGQIHFNIWADQAFGCQELDVQFFNFSTGVQEGTSTCYWDFGDETFSTEASPRHHYASPGRYNVKVRITDENACTAEQVFSQMITINPSPLVSIGADTSYCGNETIELTASGVYSSYLWLPNLENTPSILTYPIGEVILRVEDDLGCPGYDTIHLIPKPYPIFDLGPDTTFCAGGFAALSVPVSEGAPQWSTGESAYTLIVDSTSEISVLVINQFDCKFRDTILIQVLEYPSIASIIQDTLGCIGDQEAISLESDATHFLWNTGDTSQNILVEQAGHYIVFAYNEMNGVACGISDSIDLHFLPYASLESPDTFKFCFEFEDELIISTPTQANYYDWIGFERAGNSNELLVSAGGKYQVHVYDYPNCKKTQEILVEDICPLRLYVPSAFTPNGKGGNEKFYPVAPNYEILSFKIFNRWGELIFVGQSEHDQWDGTYHGNPVKEGVYVWLCEAQGYDEKFYKKTIQQSGTVTLIR